MTAFKSKGPNHEETADGLNGGRLAEEPLKAKCDSTDDAVNTSGTFILPAYGDTVEPEIVTKVHTKPRTVFPAKKTEDESNVKPTDKKEPPKGPKTEAKGAIEISATENLEVADKPAVLGVPI